MCLKVFVTAAFGSSEPFYLENGRVLPAPSLRRKSTDSLIVRSSEYIVHIWKWVNVQLSMQYVHQDGPNRPPYVCVCKIRQHMFFLITQKLL